MKINGLVIRYVSEGLRNDGVMMGTLTNNFHALDYTSKIL